MRTLRRLVAGAALVSGLLAAAGCKTGDGEAAPREPAHLTMSQLADERPSAPVFERVAAGTVPGELTGFGLAGAAVCLPLPEGRSCLAAAGTASPTGRACAEAGGKVLVCEDCSVICSVAVPLRP